jgi:hypothetical protein
MISRVKVEETWVEQGTRYGARVMRCTVRVLDAVLGTYACCKYWIDASMRAIPTACVRSH